MGQVKELAKRLGLYMDSIPHPSGPPSGPLEWPVRPFLNGLQGVVVGFGHFDAPKKLSGEGYILFQFVFPSDNVFHNFDNQCVVKLDSVKSAMTRLAKMSEAEAAKIVKPFVAQDSKPYLTTLEFHKIKVTRNKQGCISKEVITKTYKDKTIKALSESHAKRIALDSGWHVAGISLAEDTRL